MAVASEMALQLLEVGATDPVVGAAARSLVSWASQHREEAVKAKPALLPREIQVLLLLLAGRTIQQAAVVLGVGARTVSLHRRRLMKKLDIATSAELGPAARRLGIIN